MTKKWNEVKGFEMIIELVVYDSFTKSKNLGKRLTSIMWS